MKDITCCERKTARTRCKSLSSSDLIVIATHGRTGWRHLVFDSVAEKVVNLATCPVLTIRPTQAGPEQSTRDDLVEHTSSA
jgi:hypothetical protein